MGERDFTQNVGAALLVYDGASSCVFEGRPGAGLNQPNTTTGMGSCVRLQFSSMHTGVVGFLFGDGSVHMLSQNIGVDASSNGCAYPSSTKNFPLNNLINPADGNAVGNYE